MHFFNKRFSVIKLRLWALPVLVLILSTALVTPVFCGGSSDPYPNFYAEAHAHAENRDSGGKCVYLSFDDGPSACTDEILDILAEKGVPATFFVIGPE